MSELTVAAVIRSKNRAHCIAEAIRSVQDQTVDVDILLVDSGSTDRTVEIAESMGVRVIRIGAEEFSYGRAINIGIRNVHADLVLVLSSHCVLPDNGWLARAIQHFSNDDRVVGLNGADSLQMRNRSEVPEGGLSSLELGAVSDRVVQRVPWHSFSGFSNHGALVRRACAVEHPFDETLEACEDKQWANRVVKNGWLVVYVSGLRVSGTHRRGEGMKALHDRSIKEAAAMSAVVGYPMWTTADAVSFGCKLWAARSGLKRLSALRPANLVESHGRIQGSRQWLAKYDEGPSPCRTQLLHILGGVNFGTGSLRLVNFPLHDNAGDSAIWLGQRILLESLGAYRKARSYTPALRLQKADSSADVVVVRGGGYFNNIWETEVDAVAVACRVFSGSRLIFMPQSLGAIDGDALRKLQSAIGGHRRVELFVRDERSVTRASELFPDASIKLCPDAASALSRTTLMAIASGVRRDLPSVRVFARSDTEGDSSLLLAARLRGLPTFDFCGNSSTLIRFSRRVHECVLQRFPAALARILLVRLLPASGLLEKHAVAELRSGLKLLLGAECVVTDRLHVAILASILEIEVRAVDTGYGKLRAYFAAWPSSFVTFVPTVDEALRSVRVPG